MKMKKEKIDFKKTSKLKNFDSDQKNRIVNFSDIEKKWQDKWEKKKVFEVKENKKNKFYVLEQFAYPSGSGLHIGHAFIYTIGDIFARFKRMQGFNVLHPTGYDSLGLPAENAAIKAKIHPKTYTDNAIKYFSKQLKSLGFSYDWNRLFWTHDPNYYKWDQWIFLKMLEKGLVYQKQSPVNYCKKCDTVLANEQVHSGKCWRHEDTAVEIKHLKQWYFKITDYAEELNDFSKLNQWPDLIKKLQKNWIGKSYGTEIDFKIENKDINCIIVHGCPSDKEKAMNPEKRTYDKHWMPWIKNELNKKEINVKIPLMPEPWKASYLNWKKEFEKNDINEKTILIGHSCGSSFLVRWLGETKKKVRKLILIAPWKIAESGNAPKEFYDYEIDTSIKDRVGEIIIFTSDNERPDGKKSAKIFNKDLGGQIIELKNKGHYILDDMGTKEFPELLDKILNETWPIFTTRPDTIYGVTFMVVSAQHPRLIELVTKEQKKQVEKFVKKLSSVKEEDIDQLEKEGVFTGSYAINPINNEKIPVYAGNFVLADYGCGMVMAVPSHDQRDFEFAKKYNILIREVIQQGLLGAVVGADKTIETEFKKLDIYYTSKENTYFIKSNSDKKKEVFNIIQKYMNKNYYSDIWVNGEIFVILKNKIYNISKNDLKKAQEEVNKLNVPEEFSNLTKIKKEWETLVNDKIWDIDLKQAYTDEGTLVNSNRFNGLNSKKAIEEISIYIENKKLGKKTINFRLKDWLISRQRYWGTPIPIIYCDKCGVVPVSEKDLPIILPEKVKFGKGNPLETAKSWINTKCPKCKGNGKRETDTMDTFVNSSWYHLRFCDPKNNTKIFDPEKANYWNPIDIYIGGKEHACMHDIYIRFYHKFLRDLELLKTNEPAEKLFVQGIVHGEDGNKMSKSLGNTVDPMEIINKYGADSLRLFLVSVASPDSDFNWSDKGVLNINKLINKIINYFENVKIGKSSKRIESKLNKTIKEITQDIEKLRYNLAIIKLRQLFENIEKEKEISKKDAESFLKLLSPFCPHIAEELWSKLGHKDFISLADWPVCDEKKIDEKLEKAEQLVDNTISDTMNILKIIQDKGKKPKKVYIYVMPSEKQYFDEKKIEKRVQKQVKIFAVNDKDKYDPKAISKKSKPGRPGIYVE
jgi:leucyl-tRNA synthetase